MTKSGSNSKMTKRSNMAGMSLADIHASWLELPHPKKPGSLNRDRSKSDLLNHKRALQCFAAGSRNSWDDLSQVSAKAFEVTGSLLSDYVEAGTQNLAGKKGKVASKKTTANMVSCVKAIRAAVFEAYGRPEGGPGAQQLLNNLPRRRNRKGFPTRLWPERLQHEWADYRTWKLKPILTPAEGAEYRRTVCRPITIDNKQAGSLNVYIGYLVQERSMADFGLLELCNTKTFSDYLEWYFALDADRRWLHRG